MSETHYTLVRSSEFDGWLGRLRDARARQRIIDRLQRLRLGNFGDRKPIGGGVSELRLAFGPGYRIYYSVQGDRIVLLLAGGTKGTQTRDIERAKRLLKDWTP